MIQPVNAHKLGLALGGAMGVWHFTWSVLVAIGWAQYLIDWIFRFHFIRPPYIITPFAPELAIALIIVTTGLGYLIGWLLAALWNWVNME